MLEEGGGAIENTIVKHKISRMVIDSITSFALLFENELKKREAALALFSMISNWNCTSLLTYEGEPLHDTGPDHKALEFESDAIIILYYLRTKKERNHYLEVLKMRGTKHSQSVYHFHIKERKGIVIEKRPTSGTEVRAIT